jgi:hypothetical protein
MLYEKPYYNPDDFVCDVSVFLEFGTFGGFDKSSRWCVLNTLSVIKMC